MLGSIHCQLGSQRGSHQPGVPVIHQGGGWSGRRSGGEGLQGPHEHGRGRVGTWCGPCKGSS